MSTHNALRIHFHLDNDQYRDYLLSQSIHITNNLLHPKHLTSPASILSMSANTGGQREGSGMIMRFGLGQVPRCPTQSGG